MKENYNVRRYAKSLLICFIVFAFAGTGVLADIIKTGSAYVPGYCNPKKKVKWRVAMSKTPYGNQAGSKELHFWLDFELCDPQPGDDVSFVVCAMLNVNQAKRSLPAFRADINGGTWTCVSTGSENWYPNYHMGCKRVRVHAGNGYKAQPFDTRVEFSVDFDEDEVAAPYIDLALDCPNGFSGCSGAFDAPDKWLVPGSGNFPQSETGCNGTSSWWVTNIGGRYRPDINSIGRVAPIPTGNWYTMAYPDNVFESALVGQFTNVPNNSNVTITFPPSTGGGTWNLTPTNGIIDVDIPFVITEELMHDLDEHMHFSLWYPESEVLPDPDATIEFLGQVVATGTSFFPNGDDLFIPDQEMHGIQIQWVIENDNPTMVSELLTEISPGLYELTVEASDASTMAIGASVVYTVNGTDETFLPLDFDDPASDGSSTFFVGQIGPLGPDDELTSYTVYVVDDAGNMLECSATLTDVDDGMANDGFALFTNFPNPVEGATTIRYRLPRAEWTTIKLFDIFGKEIATVLDRYVNPGEHSVSLDFQRGILSSLADGVYFYQMEAGSFVQAHYFSIAR